MKAVANEAAGKNEAGCSVSSKFNFTVGGLAILVAVLIGCLVYVYWRR
jgi:hypothetical protein